MQYKQQIIPGGKKMFYAWFEAMHTRVDAAILTDVDRSGLPEFVLHMQNEIRKYEQIGNRFDPKSEISHVNENAYENEVRLSAELFNILADCKLYKQSTNGHFDISVYSTSGIQSDDKVFLLNKEQQTIRFTHSGVLLDLSGFLKGYVLNIVVGLANNAGFDNFIINLGNSSVFAKGNHPHGAGWKVKIRESETELVLQDECLTTSGNSDATRWPLMNPKNGIIEKNKMPASVVTRDAALGEVLAKVAYLATETERNNIFQLFDVKLINTQFPIPPQGLGANI